MKIQKLISAFLVISMLSSCIGYRDYKLPQLETKQIKTTSKKRSKVFLNFIFSSALPGSKENFSAGYSRAFKEEFIQSDCCILVSEESDADVVINATFSDNGDPSLIIFAAITGATLFVIPSWKNLDVSLKADVTKGKKEYNYYLNDSMFMAQWLPFILAVPFRFKEMPVNLESSMNINLFKNLILKMQKDGVI